MAIIGIWTFYDADNQKHYGNKSIYTIQPRELMLTVETYIEKTIKLWYWWAKRY